MRNLFDPPTANEVKLRVARLAPDANRLWGTMTAAQAMAHCSGGMEMAVGDLKPPRKFIGLVLGGFIRRMALGNDEPMRKNSPTVDTLVIRDERDLGREQQRLCGLIDRFTAAGPAGCTTHPHSFFGPMTPQEWAILMYKHLDHHLRQFGG